MEEEKKEVIEVQKSEEPINKENAKQVPPTQEAPKNKKGLCIASLVLGIVSLVLFCIWYLSIPCGILAIIFGVLGIKSMNKGMAVAGLVTGAIGLLVSMIVVISLFMFGFAIGITDALDTDYGSYYNYNLYD